SVLRVVGFNRTDTIWMVELPAPAVVVKLPGELMMNPDGCAVTVLAPSAKPAALALRVVLPEAARPCTKKLPTKVDDVVNVTVAPPATVPSAVIVAMAVEATLIVTVTALGGVAPRLTENCCCRSRPTWMLVVLKLIVGAVTVAITVRPVLGGLKPAGGTTATSEVPATAGSNVACLKVSPPLKTSGLPTMAPTPGPPVWSVAVTGTFTVRPPRTV